ncbi:MAG: type IX secretion system outer membrane channel protein PorV [Paludibacteraceae bacterium]|nr:type IX secretion system outer membrane channel protein PorV [Paludibacteraceae bacterium]
MKKSLLSLAALVALSMNALAYDVNPILTAMPALTIAPDAHAAGMGDIGVATNADMNSQFWNAAKYPYLEDKGGISASYTPWLRKLVNDIDLAYLTGFYRFDDKQAISASFTYFSMGKVSLVSGEFNPGSGDLHPEVYATAKPNEWSLDVAYSRKLHEYVSMAATLRFMYSDLNNGINWSGTGESKEMYPAWTMAADIALYYRQPIELPMGTSYFALGFQLSNLGGKMSYDKNETSNFIPARFRLGVSYEIPCDNYNRLQVSVECDKLLVPSTYSKYASGINDKQGDDKYKWDETNEEYSKVSSPKGWFQSFNDAPKGAKEEFKEVRWGVGVEYSYNRQFFARVGYSHEDKMKGNRRYATVGAGFKLSIVRFDMSYCIATNSSNPLDQTMRFTLGFDLAGIKDLVNNKR